MANIPPAKLAALNLSGTLHPYTAFVFELMYDVFKMLDVSIKISSMLNISI